MKTVRVLLADDHKLVRAGIRSLLETLDDVEVVGEAVDGRAALELIGQGFPDIVLMDIAMPGLNGLEAVSQISERFPFVNVIVLSMYTNEEYVLRALRDGAAGYLAKDCGPEELSMAIRSVSQGQKYLCPKVSKLIAEYVQRSERQNQSPFDSLSPRQREVLQLIAEGHTTQQIAQILEIHSKTVETHRRNLMNHLDIHDIAGLVRYAVRVGLISVDTE